jgi:preprotein translocase SecE subunit
MVPPRPRPVARDDEGEPRRIPGKGFISESWAELKKVDWPGQSQVIQGTVVVIIACLIVGVYLYLNDIAWKQFVQDLLLR